MLYVKEVKGKGRGVFSDVDISYRSTIENSPLIRFSKDEIENIESTILSEYWFKDGEDGVIGLGLVSIYNHSSNPNAQILILSSENIIIVRAIKDILAHEEICHNYNNEKSKQFKG